MTVSFRIAIQQKRKAAQALEAGEVEAIKDSIKAEMADRDLDELEAGSYIVRYKTVATSRFDSTAFKKTYEDLYKAFLKQTTSRRFSISY